MSERESDKMQTELTGDDGNEVELLFIERSQRIYLVENRIPPLWWITCRCHHFITYKHLTLLIFSVVVVKLRVFILVVWFDFVLFRSIFIKISFSFRP